ARSEFIADRKITAPGATTKRHANLSLLLCRLRKELATDFFEPLLQCRIDAVSGDVKEAILATCGADLFGDLHLLRRSGEPGVEINDGDLRKRFLHRSTAERSKL